MAQRDFIKWINALKEEVIGITYCNDVWKQLNEIENNSKHFKKYGRHLQHWQEMNYSYTIITRIAKLTEPGKLKSDDYSFRLFLNKLKNNKYISFEQFLKTYHKPVEKERKYELIERLDNGVEIGNTNFTIEDAQKDFEDITKVSYTTTDFSSMLDEDIKQLSNIHDKIKKLRNKKIAHFTKTTKAIQAPTYQEINNYIEILQKLCDKYSVLLTNTSHEYHYIDLNIKTVFKERWID